MSLSFPLAAVIIPEDILIEILVRLPAYSLMRFKCVSKHWFSLISSRYFTNLFVKFSSSRKRERRVFADVDLDNDKMVFSSRLFNLDATTSFVQQLNRDLTMTEIYNGSEFVNAVRGWMCFRVDNYRMEGDAQIRIINFTTRQVLSLPLVDSNILLGSDPYFKWNYFGYDPVNDKYKVLSIISSIKEGKLISEIQVFVLGDGASWKSLTFSPLLLHDPYEGGISINGVLYYGAWSYEKSSALMSFDLSSEELNLIELSWENHIKWKKEVCSIDLINYQDHVAVFDDSCLNTEGILNLLVLEDAGKSKWSHKVLVLPCDQIRARLELKDTYDLRIRARGTSGSREVTLCGRYEDRCDHSTYAFYDLEKNHITRVFVIDPPYSFRETNLWEDVESIMYLEL